MDSGRIGERGGVGDGGRGQGWVLLCYSHANIPNRDDSCSLRNGGCLTSSPLCFPLSLVCLCLGYSKKKAVLAKSRKGHMSVLSIVSMPRFCFLTVPVQSPLNCVALELKLHHLRIKVPCLRLALCSFRLFCHLDICCS